MSCMAVGIHAVWRDTISAMLCCLYSSTRPYIHKLSRDSLPSPSVSVINIRRGPAPFAAATAATAAAWIASASFARSQPPPPPPPLRVVVWAPSALFNADPSTICFEPSLYRRVPKLRPRGLSLARTKRFPFCTWGLNFGTAAGCLVHGSSLESDGREYGVRWEE